MGSTGPQYSTGDREQLRVTARVNPCADRTMVVMQALVRATGARALRGLVMRDNRKVHRVLIKPIMPGKFLLASMQPGKQHRDEDQKVEQSALHPRHG